MEEDGNVWWGQTLDVSSLTRKGLLFILRWSPSTFLYSRQLRLNVVRFSDLNKRLKGKARDEMAFAEEVFVTLHKYGRLVVGVFLSSRPLFPSLSFFFLTQYVITYFLP